MDGSAPDRRWGAAEAERYDAVALGANAALYEHYADRILRATGIRSGLCLDAGTGGGYLGLALARITELDFVLLDRSADFLRKAEGNISLAGLSGRARTLVADVHEIPLDDRSVDLVVSRGSIPFWTDPVRALREIHRVLAPGGKTFVGVGRGSAARPGPGSGSGIEPGPGGAWDPASGFLLAAPGRVPRVDLRSILDRSGLPGILHEGDDGRWIELSKEAAE